VYWRLACLWNSSENFFFDTAKKETFSTKITHTLGCRSEIDEDDSKGDDNSDEDDNDYDDNDDYDKDDDVDDDGNDNGDSEEVQISDILCITKSGRTCRTWEGRYFYF